MMKKLPKNIFTRFKQGYRLISPVALKPSAPAYP
jgi:hypothetical protein